MSRTKSKAEDLKIRHGYKGAIRAVKLMIERCLETEEGNEIKEYWIDVLNELEKL
jgi:hypothetical protein